jgi:hypothetical protein
VDAGVHEVRLKTFWCSSPRCVLELKDGETSRLRCGPGGSDLMTAFDSVFRTHRYISLVAAASN